MVVLVWTPQRREDLRTNGLHDVGARGRGVAIAQKMSIVRDQVVENQRSVERTTARRDHTPSFFVFAEFTDKGRYSSKVTFLRHNTTQLNTHSKQTQSIYEFC